MARANPSTPCAVIANRSSGKQGYAIAAEAAMRGADVVLVTTVDLPTPTGVRTATVETASQMEAAMRDEAAEAHIVVMAAAVADFRPKSPVRGKIKKHDGVPDIVLEPTADILAGLGAAKPDGQILVGFAAETSDLLANAQAKLDRKHLDLIVANDVGAPKTGFQHDTNEVTILRVGGSPVSVGLHDKREIARAVVNEIVAVRERTGLNSGPQNEYMKE